MNNRILFTLFLVLVLFSCKKHRLKNEKAMLEGTWEWNFSIKTSHMSSPPFTTWTDTIFPSDVSSSYGITFLKKGEVQFLENGEIEEEYRTVFTKFRSGGVYCWIGGNAYEFSIDLDNQSDHSFSGCVNSDTLTIRYASFPFPNISSTNGNVGYLDFFKKVN